MRKRRVLRMTRWAAAVFAVFFPFWCSACADYGTHSAQSACEQMLNTLEVGQAPGSSTEDLCHNVALSTDEGAIIFHGEFLADCLAEIRFLSSKLGITAPTLFSERLPSCRALFENGRSDGEACHIDLECPVGSHCNSNYNQCPGRCERYTRDGDVCGEEEGTCDYARSHCEDGKCVACVQKGDSCSENRQCELGQYCIESRCQGPQKEDGPCEIIHSLDCQEGLFCGADQTCQAPSSEGAGCLTREEFMEITTKGTAYGLGLANYPQCADGLACRAGVCAQLVSRGGACDPADWPECAERLYCDRDSKTCEPPRKLGESCKEGMPCEGFPMTICALDEDGVSGVCVERNGIGESCSDQWDCAIGLVCRDNSCQRNRCRDFLTSQGLTGLVSRD